MALGDQPEVSAETVTLLIRAFHSTGRGIVVPAYQGRRGHPLLIATGYHAELLSHYDGIGVRGLLAAHPADCIEVDVDSCGILEDVDVPEDYQRVAARLRRGLA